MCYLNITKFISCKYHKLKYSDAYITCNSCRITISYIGNYWLRSWIDLITCWSRIHNRWIVGSRLKNLTILNPGPKRWIINKWRPERSTILNPKIFIFNLLGFMYQPMKADVDVIIIYIVTSFYTQFKFKKIAIIFSSVVVESLVNLVKYGSLWWWLWDLSGPEMRVVRSWGSKSTFHCSSLGSTIKLSFRT